MRQLSVVTAIIGIIFIVLAVVADTTADFSTTLNIGLLQGQMMKLHFGIGMLIVSAILGAGDAIVEAVSRGTGAPRRSTMADMLHDPDAVPPTGASRGAIIFVTLVALTIAILLASSQA